MDRLIPADKARTAPDLAVADLSGRRFDLVNEIRSGTLVMLLLPELATRATMTLLELFKFSEYALAAFGTRLAVVSAEPPEGMLRRWRALSLTFTGLSDPHGLSLRTLLPDESGWRTLLQPAALIIDKGRRIRGVHRQRSAWDRPLTGVVLPTLAALRLEEPSPTTTLGRSKQTSALHPA